MRYNRGFAKTNNCIPFTDRTIQISKYLADLRYEDIPAEVVERAKVILMHTVGAALAARGSDVAKKADAMALAINNGVGGTVTRWAGEGKFSAVSAAFLAGTLADALDWEDCSFTGHPSAGVIPVALITAEERHKSGKELITAIVGAYELYQRIADSVEPDAEKRKLGWGLTSWQIFASTLTAAKIYGLDARKIDQAIGMAIEHSTIPASYHGTTMSDFYHYEYGYRAKDGVIIAKAVEKGIHNQRDMLDVDGAQGYFAAMTAEPRPEALTDDLGKTFKIMDTLLKPWPANMWIQSALQALAEVVSANGIHAEDIAEIVVDPPVKSRMDCPEDGWTSITHAEFSIPFVLASWLLDPVPGAQWYTEDRLKDSALLALAKKVKAGPSAEENPRSSFDVFRAGDFPVRTVTVRTNCGKEYSVACGKHPGHPHNMFTAQQAADRFRIQAAPVLQGEKLEQAIDALLHVETVEDVAMLGRFLGLND